MSDVAVSLKGEVEAAVLAEFERLGPSGFNRAPIIKRFDGRVARPTLYRWVSALIKSGRPGQHVARVVKAAATDRAARSAAPAEDVAAEAAAALPLIVGVEDVIVPAGTALDAVAQIAECISVARQVLAYARTSTGEVRVPRLMIAAAESLRKAIQAGVELQKALHDTAQTERFQNEIIATVRAVAAEHPAAAELLLRRIEQVALRWS